MKPGSREPGAGGREAEAARPARPDRRERRWRRMALVPALGLAATVPIWGPLVLARMSFFRVRRVAIEGAHYVAPHDILARLHVDTMVSVWAPLRPLEKRVAGLPEVRTVAIRRKLPGT